MNLARSLRIVLAVALLAAWQNALVHPVEHVDEHGGLVHLAGGHDGHGHEDEEGGPSALCDAIAAVAACVDGPAGIVFAVPQGVKAFFAWQAGELRHAPLLAYRSQAPPQFS